MAAMTVTPEIVRVVFLRRILRSLRFSFGFRAAMISELEGICWRWYFAAIWSLMLCASSCVGDGVCISLSIISRTGLSAFDVGIR